MKKLLFILSFLLTWFALAAETTRPIELVKLRYCDFTWDKYESTRLLNLNIEQNEKKEFCVEIINTWKSGVNVGMNILDWSLTADSEQKRACEPEWIKSQFWNYAWGYPTVFYLSWNSSKQIYPYIQFTGWVAWEKYGCITLHYVDQKDNLQIDGGNINVFSRIWYFLQANVSWEIVKLAKWVQENNPIFQNIWSNNLFPIYRKNSDHIFWNFFKDNFSRANIENSGNVSISWNLEMWYKYWWVFNNSLENKSYLILPNKNIIVEQKLSDLIKILGWPVNTYYFYKYDDKILSQKNFHFFFPWILVPIWMYFVYKKFKKQNKKIYSHAKSRKNYVNVKRY